MPCATCRFSRAGVDAAKQMRLECHRFPPSVLLAPVSRAGGIEVQFFSTCPPVNGDHQCGEFEPADLKTAS